jgi:hypothetical protein
LLLLLFLFPFLLQHGPTQCDGSSVLVLVSSVGCMVWLLLVWASGVGCVVVIYWCDCVMCMVSSSYWYVCVIPEQKKRIK